MDAPAALESPWYLVPVAAKGYERGYASSPPLTTDDLLQYSHTYHTQPTMHTGPIEI